jgi:Ca-activated chloride channel family protein
MAGRHARVRDNGTRTPLFASIVAVLALSLTAGGVYALRSDRAADARSGGCTSTRTLTVAAAKEVVGVVRAATSRLMDADECTAYTIREVSGSDVVAEAAAGAAPDVWLPESSAWVEALNATTPPKQWAAGTSLATSPVVVALPKDQAVRLSGHTPSWAELFQGADAARLADPGADIASRIALFSARASLGSSPAAVQKAGALLVFLSRAAAGNSGQLFYWYSEDPDKSPPFVASEQAIFAYNRAHPEDALSAVIPSGGTGSLDYPFVVSPSLAPAAGKAVDLLGKELASAPGHEELAKAGLRTAGSATSPVVTGLETAEVTPAPPLSTADKQALLGRWESVRRDMRMLAVIDISGSMGEKAGTSTRAKLASQSAINAVGILPGGAKIGVWFFSTDLGPNHRDYRPIVPVAGLQEVVGGKSQRQRLIEAAATLPGALEGDTGLYDTVLAAFRQQQKDYDPRYVNSVVVLTDGKNDDRRTIALSLLVSTLRGADPTRPVRIITIGIGPSTDEKALQRIAEATGGNAYIAREPSDMENVFVKALLSRH